MNKVKQVEARFYDGKSSKAQEVLIEYSSFGIQIRMENNHRIIWNLSDLEIISGNNDPNFKIGNESENSGARLVLEDQHSIELFKQNFPNLTKKHVKQQRLIGKVFLLSFAAMMSFIAIVIILIPLLSDRIVAVIPKNTEKTIGKNVRAQIVSLFTEDEDPEICMSPKGVEAIEKMINDISSVNDLDYAIEPIVLRTYEPDQANALALPGGYIVVFSQLIAGAKSPDELMGVIAHEIGHVHHQHSLKNFITVSGYSVIISNLIGDFTGSTVILAVTQQLLQAGYTREAEVQADEFAGKTLQKLNYDIQPLGDFLNRIDKRQVEDDFKLVGLLRTHPYSSERSVVFKKYRVEKSKPSLSADQWNKLKNICDETIAFEE